MVAIVTGARLGLELGSLATLRLAGQSGQAVEGRNRQGVYVDVANGNLVVQQQDDLLASRGEDTAALRTYNSQGLLADDNADNWASGVLSISVTGALNAIGSSIQLAGGDGSVASYAYDSGRGLYLSTEGGGAYDKMRYIAADAQVEWTDGTTGATRRFDASGTGRLLASRDSNGNTQTCAYGAGGLLSAVTTASGDAVYYDYSGNNLTQVRTVAGGATTTRVHYAYDTSNRLASVSVDLTPSDNSVADGNIYQTTYAYDGSSNRLARVTQTDGTSVTIAYVDAGAGVFMVSSFTDALNETTRFSYGLAAPGVASYALVTDPQGQATRYDFDAQGQVTGITAPAVNGVASTRQFAYTATGDVASVVDGEGRTTVFQYDANGNQMLQRDAAGQTIARTFDAHNQLLTETLYASPDPDGAGPGQPGMPLTTRYVYDASGRNQLRFAIDADGRVTESRYDGFGERATSIAYGSATYAIAGLSTTAVPTEAAMVGWAAGLPSDGMQRTDFSYDARGQLQTRTTYAKVTAAGVGVADGSQSVERYVHDASGVLLQTISATGAVTSYSYDGLGRVLAEAKPLGQTTVYQYSDTANKTTVSLTNGLATTRSYDRAGRLVSELVAGTVPDETKYFYDSAGRLRMTRDATGVCHWMLYDEDGRQIADVDGNGTLTETSYDRSGRAVHTVTWGQPASFQLLGTSAAGPNLSATLASIRPAPSSADCGTWTEYDAAGRIVRVAASTGMSGAAAVTQNSYDGAGRVVQVVRYATLIPADGSAGSVQPGAVPVPGASAQDRVTRNFYDGQGHITGVLDPEGDLTVVNYNAAGLEVERIAYATVTNSALWASGTLSQLVPLASADDIHAVTLYDGKGQAIAQIDGEGYLTETVYDADGRVTQTVRYANRAIGPVTAASSVGAIRPAPTANDQATMRSYDALGRLAQQTSPEGVITTYGYDSVGHLVSTVLAATTSEQRTLLARYDLQGHLTGELSAPGAALLTGGQTQAQVDAVWAQYGTTYTYDAVGRRTSSRDALGNTTWFYYNSDGAPTVTINALGEARENRYDARGRLVQETVYASRTAVRGPGGVPVVAPVLSSDQSLDSITTYTYTIDGELASVTDALHNTSTRSYDAFGDVVASSDAGSPGPSLVQSASFDRRGLRTSLTADPGGANAVTSTSYDAFGRVTREVDPNGNARTQVFDRLGRIVVTRDALGANRTTSYDAFDRALTQTDALGNTTRYGYDNVARSITVTTPEGVQTVTTFDRHGQVFSVRDGNGQVTTTTYDLNGRVVKVTTPLSATTTSYDAIGQVAQTSDANGTVTQFTYDPAGRVLTRIVDPTGLNLATTYQYDAKGQQVTVTDPSGVATSFQYDAKGQVLTQVLDPSGFALKTTYTYDAKGRVLTVTAPSGMVTQYRYDALGRRTQECVDATGLKLSRSWAYDAKGNVTSSTDARGAVTRYAYDADDRLVFTLDAAGGVEQVSYDAEGRVLKALTYVTPVAMTGLGSSVSIADLQARIVAVPGVDVAEQRVLYRDGRLRATVDGTGGVVTYSCDANGNVVSRVAYANRIDLARWVPGTMPVPVADAAHDDRTSVVYDALDRAIYTMNGVGAVVSQRYDGSGKVVERIAYAAPVSSTTPATQAGIAAALSSVANPALDATRRSTYDAAGRLAWTVDGVGAVTHYVYDADGNVVQEVAYATALPAGAVASSAISSVNDRVVTRAYDTANRLVFEVDAMNAATEQVFGSAGHLLRRIAYANPLVTRPAVLQSGALAAIRAALRPDGAIDRVTRYGYDTADRQVTTQDAEGEVVEVQLDGAGNVLVRTAYANRRDPTLAAIATAAAMRPTASASDRVTRYGYDAAARVVTQADPLGFVTTTSYDGAGRVVSMAKPLNEVDAYAYNAAGQRIAVTDASNATERYVFDGVGRELSFTDKNGAVWTYDSDAAGRRIREASPAVALTTTSFTGGAVVAAAPTLASVVTVLGYDALGNLTLRTEAAGRAEERTTRYEYDAAGRQVRVLHPAVGVYDASHDPVTLNGAGGVATRQDTAAVPLETRTCYDVLGNAVANVDVGGALGQKVYDQAGRVVYEIDALGFVTAYGRDAFGETTSLTRFASSTSLAARAVTQSSQAAGRSEVDAVVNAAGFKQATDRTLLTLFDRAGRSIEIRQPNAFSYDATSGAGFYAQARTRTTYDAFGEVVQVATVRDAAGSSWFKTAHYFDRDGRETATVDAAGYMTVRGFDAAGNVATVTEYATALAAGVSPWSVPLPPSRSADDRSTRYAYDLLNRKVAETRLGVECSTAVDGTSTLADLTTSFAYDAVGNATQVIDAAQQATLTVYDALGRVTATVRPKGAGLVNVAGAPMTEYRRDAHGNLVVQVEYAQGALKGADGVYRAAAVDAGDRTTLTRFDALGRALEVQDANGAVGLQSFDAYGHVAKSWRALTAPDGTQRTQFQLNVYDAVGQLVQTKTPASTTKLKDGIKAGYKPATYEMSNPDTMAMSQATPNVLDLTWSNLIDPAGGAVRIRVDCSSAIDPALVFTISQEFTASAASGGASATWTDETGSVTGIHVLQLVGTQWVARWDGTLATAMGSTALALTQDQAGLVTETQEYDAFGETVRKGTQGGRQEYDEYDAAGSLWRTNAGDGVGVIRLYDLQGNVTSEIRSSGSGGVNADIRTFATPEAAANAASTRRVVIKYDALGRVTERDEAVRIQQQGGAAVQRQFTSVAGMTSAQAAGSATSSASAWSGQNSVSLTWNNLSGLGSGDVRVRIEYLTPSIMVSGSYSGEGGYSAPDAYFGRVARSYTSPILNGDRAAAGATLSWAETAATVEAGGVGTITRIVIDKRDFAGNWKTVIDQMPGYGGNEVDVAAAVDSNALVTLETRAAASSTWLPASIVNFGTSLRFDADALAPGGYEYRVTSKSVSGDTTTVASGTFTLALPPLNTIPNTFIYGQPGVIWGAQAAPGAIVWQPPSAAIAQQSFRYFSGGVWNTLNLVRRTAAGLDGVDTSALPAGSYRFELLWVPSTGVASAHATGTFTINANRSGTLTVDAVAGSTALSTLDGETSAQVIAVNGAVQSMQPKVLQAVDRWGNLVRTTDPRNAAWATTYRYNASNQMVQQTQPDADGTGAAVTRIFYDQLGRQVAVQDARGNVNGRKYDELGNVVQEIHADGGVVRHGYDAFGDTLFTSDPEVTQNVVSFAYDHVGNLVRVDKGAARVYTTDASYNVVIPSAARTLSDQYRYDELGQKIEWTNAAGERVQYFYDLRGNIVETRRPAFAVTVPFGALFAQSTKDAYDAQGNKIAEIDANGFTSYWTYDYFGQLTSHTDLGGTGYAYTYDAARQLIAQTNTRGQRLAYGYDAAGQVLRIVDSADNQTTDYAYDLSGRRLTERVVRNGVTYQDNHLGYDAMGNLRDVADARVHLCFKYDKAGNRIQIDTSINYQGLAGDTQQKSSRYFAYDAMNRQTAADMGNAALTAYGTQGHLVTYYSNGNRKSDKSVASRVGVTVAGNVSLIDHYDADGQAVYGSVAATYAKADGETLETYSYDALNRLQSVVRDGVQVDLRLYDAADGVIRSGSTNLPVGYRAALDSNVQTWQSDGQEIRIDKYDPYGRMLHQRVLRSDGTDQTTISWDPTEALRPGMKALGYDAMGNALGYVTQDRASSALTTYKTTLNRFDSYQAQRTDAVSSNGGTGVSTEGYDVNGFLTTISESRSANSRSFINDATGKALLVDQGGQVERQLIVNGEVLGLYGVGVNAKNPSDQNGNPNFSDIVDLGFGYAPVTSTYPAAAPGAYRVQTGDTLQSIAQTAYGDSQLWYRVAEANGLLSTNELKVGQTLNIPNRVSTIHNNATTFKPYDPSTITGSLSPSLVMPAVDDGCGAVGKILMVVVAVVVTVLSNGTLTEPTLETEAAITAGTDVLDTAVLNVAGAQLASVPAAMVSSGLGAFAGQVVGGVTGTISDLDWKSIALSAISGGVTAGLAPYSFGSGVPGVVLRGMTANAVGQGVAVAVGLQRKFDWQAVAAAGAGAATGAIVGSAASHIPNVFAGRAVTGFAAGLVTAAARGRSVDVQQVAVDAFGNALGEAWAVDLSEPATSTISNTYVLQSGRAALGLKAAGFVGLRPSDSAADLIYSPNPGQSNSTNTDAAERVLDLAVATQPSAPSLEQVALSGGHYYLVGLIGKALNLPSDRLYSVMAHSQYPDQVSALDAAMNGARSEATLSTYEPGGAGVHAEMALHALNGRRVSENLDTYLTIIARNSDDDATVGVALHGLVDSIFHSRLIEGELRTYTAPLGHFREGSEPDYVSEDQVRVAAGAVIRALELVSGSKLTDSGRAGVAAYVNETVRIASEMTDADTSGLAPDVQAANHGPRMELNFRSVVEAILGQSPDARLLRPNDIQSIGIAKAITKDLTIQETQQFLSSRGQDVSWDLAERFATRAMRAAAHVIDEYDYLTTGQRPPVPFSPDQLMDTQTWSFRGLFDARVPEGPGKWSIRHVVPGYQPLTPSMDSLRLN